MPTELDFACRLIHDIHKAGGVRALSRRLGVSAAYISDLRLGRREPGEKVLKAMGLRREIRTTRVVRYFSAARSPEKKNG